MYGYVDKHRTTVLIDRDLWALLKACLITRELTFSEWVEENARRWITVAMPDVPGMTRTS